MATRRKAFFILSGVGALLVGACVAMFSVRTSHPVFFQHGTPEVPSARAFMIGNPFRDRGDEEIAERLLHDLRGRSCVEILTENRFTGEPEHICEVMRGTSDERLVFREGAPRATFLIYWVPEAHAKVWVQFSRDEAGWGVSGVSAVR